MSTVETRDLRMPSAPANPREGERFEQRTTELMAGGSMVVAVLGIAAVALGIIGLAHVYAPIVAGVAVIVVGAAFACEASALATRFIRQSAGAEAGMSANEMGGGLSAEFLGGIAGIVLGILALLGVVPWVLAPVAALVFGAMLLISGGANARTSAFMVERGGATAASRLVTSEATAAAAGAKVLVGITSGVLGILGLVGIFPWTLTLVAMLCLGGALLLSGAACSGWLVNVMRR